MSVKRIPNPTPFEEALYVITNETCQWPLQLKAHEALSGRGLPHRRIEDWRWTDLRQLLRDPLTMATRHEVSVDPGDFAALDPYVIVYSHSEGAWSGLAPDGIQMSHARGPAVHGLLTEHAMAPLSLATVDRATVVQAAPNAMPTRPVLLRYTPADKLLTTRTLVEVGEGASLHIIESFEGAGGMTNSALEVRLAPGARLTRTVIQAESDKSSDISIAAVEMAAGAEIAQTTLVMGGNASRFETSISMDGEDGKATLSSASLLAGARHGDVTTKVAHRARGGVTKQVHKSALADRARGVFQGKFYVARDGQETDADMQANALLLSDEAEANHKPELEIYADNVLCAHGSTAGALDEDALFYMRQRGLDEQGAKALLIEAFVSEAFDNIEDETLSALVGDRISDWLRRNA